MRIVSLLPSATDIVCALGLREHLVGRTHECDWPPGVEEVPALTRNALPQRTDPREVHEAVQAAVHQGSSPYVLDTEALAAARPDLILTQELCAVCAVSYTEVSRAVRLLDGRPRVVSLEPRGLEDILATIEVVGELAGVPQRARELVASLRERLQRLKETTRHLPRPGVFCCEWLDPIFAAGHWVPEQVEAAGGRELVGRPHEPSREVAWEEVVAADPEAVVLMPCGVPIPDALAGLGALRRRPGWNRLPAVRAGRVWVVDGSSYFNRPGPRVVRGAEILAALLHGTGTVEPHEAVGAFS